jgi:two-component system, OmpR family, phosphate regulon response regulator PhoB
MNKPKVLIVDDEMDMRIFISTLFETNGYRPVAARDGKAGLQKARELLPDLIILDVMMPGEGGVTMFQGLKTDRNLRNIPVIMLSAVAGKTFAHYLKMLNIRIDECIPNPDAYMEKPPDALELLQLAAKLVTSQRIP